MSNSLNEQVCDCRSRCKHGIFKHMRCRDCEEEPIPDEELARFKREVLGIIDDPENDNKG